MSGISEPVFAARLKVIAAVLIAAACAVSAAAALQSRGLDADGCYYLLQRIERSQFFEVEPSRRTVQWLQQAPTVAAMSVGALPSAAAATVVFSLTLSLLPLLFVTACYPVLPPERKEWFFSRCYIISPDRPLPPFPRSSRVR